MNKERLSRIGLFSSDPRSSRVQGLENALQNLNVSSVRVIPWKVARTGSTDEHRIVSEGVDLTELELLLVLDLGANDIGAFFNRVGLLSALAELGVTIVNSVSSILLMRNKAESMRKLVSAKLPVPRTLITESMDDAAAFVQDNFPCVLKPITGFGGLGVHLIDQQFDLENIYDYLKFHSQMFGKGAFLLQEYIRGPGFDIRAFVLDGDVLATMQRVSEGDLVTNIHSGGTPRLNDIDVTELALRAADAVNGRIVGVDIIPDRSGDMWILEVNATPGWTALQRVTGLNIAEKVADAISKA